jgi:hypothetical protein
MSGSWSKEASTSAPFRITNVEFKSMAPVHTRQFLFSAMSQWLLVRKIDHTYFGPEVHESPPEGNLS